MVNIRVDSSNSTKLVDRTLWYDGDSTVSEESLMAIIKRGGTTDGLFVEELTPQIKKFNGLVSKDEQIKVKEGIEPLSFDWTIPEEYKDMDVIRYIIDKLLNETKEMSDEEATAREQRVAEEIKIYKNLELMDVLATLIYIINTLVDNNVVWGVGRGSSVSSYVLYLIGVHDIDSFKYDLKIEDFLRTK
jgi:DNA polymerase III alpha subunit